MNKYWKVSNKETSRNKSSFFCSICLCFGQFGSQGCCRTWVKPVTKYTHQLIYILLYISLHIDMYKVIEVHSLNFRLILHCCIKWPQILQLKTLLQTYTAIIYRIYNKYFEEVIDPRNKGNLLLKLKKFCALKLFPILSIVD